MTTPRINELRDLCTSMIDAGFTLSLSNYDCDDDPTSTIEADTIDESARLLQLYYVSRCAWVRDGKRHWMTVSAYADHGDDMVVDHADTAELNTILD
tara:strand:- start:243 stop:533 length:291 start_codon:yes stop_codon:yes gene_type:complete